jgi:hypothetical protein
VGRGADLKGNWEQSVGTRFEIGIINMIGKTNTALFILGALLMCITGLSIRAMHFTFLVIHIAGFAILLIATTKSRDSGPFAALWLFVTSNLTFWSCWGLWLQRSALLFGSSDWRIPENGVAFWIIFLPVFVIYELVILVRLIISNRQRTLSLFVLIAVLAQIPLTLKFAWDIAQGS